MSKMRVADSRSQQGEDRQAWDFVHGWMMQTLFCRWMVLGLVAGMFCGCSEKAETVEEKAVVEGKVEEVDPVETAIAYKLNSMIIPRLDIEDLSFEQAIDFIRSRLVDSAQIDSEPGMKGMNMVIRRPKTASDSKKSDESGDLIGEGLTDRRIHELRVRNVSFAAALRYICLMTDMRCGVDEVLVFSPKDPNAAWNDFGSVLEEKGDTSFLAGRLSQIRIHRIDFEKHSIYEAIDFLRLKSAEMETDRIINFVVHVPEGMEMPRIDELRMRDSTFEEVLKEICAKTGMRYELDPYSVILVPKDLK